MSIIQSIILGLVQGLSEFLPISSSGHLAVFQHFMHIHEEDVLTFTVMLHFGTLLSICGILERYRCIGERTVLYNQGYLYR